MWMLALALGCTGPGLTDVTDGSPSPTAATGDTATEPAACDDPASFVGSGDAALQVTAAAEFCVTGVTSVAALADLRRVRVQAGTYPWPATNGTAPYRLPACVSSAQGAVEQLAVGTIEHASEAGVDTVTYRQPLGAGPETLQLTVWSQGASPPAPALDGLMAREGVDGTNWQDLSVCEEGAGCVTLNPCATPQAGTDPERLTFARGSMALHIDVIEDGGLWIDPPRLLYRASGTLDDTAFEQADYYNLGYRYAAHGLDREVLVLLSKPIGTACGFLGRYGRAGKETLHTIDCDGGLVDDLGPVTAPTK